MCKCTPNIRTPFCGKLGCEWPAQKASIEQEENALIAEKLLGWKQDAIDSDGCKLWRDTRGERVWRTPTFTDWHSAGMILEALSAIGKMPRHGQRPDGRWYCVVYGEDPVASTTGPLAIRAAAIAYIRSAT